MNDTTISTLATGTIRSRIYSVLNITLNEDGSLRARHVVQTILLVLIILNVLIVVLESIQEIEANAMLKALFKAIDILSVAIFTVEYILRVWTCVEDPRYPEKTPIKSRLRYAISPFGLIDLMAILPFFLHTFFVADLRILRGLRLLRLERILTLGHYSKSFNRIISVIERKRVELVMSFTLIFIIMLMASSVMFFLEHDAQPDKFANIPVSMWWGVVTLTTVGYGDIVPVTVLGKLCSAVMALLGIGLVAIPSSILVNGFYELHNDGSDNVPTELFDGFVKAKTHIIATHQECLEPFGTRIAIATNAMLTDAWAIVHGVHGRPIRIVKLDAGLDISSPVVHDHRGNALEHLDISSFLPLAQKPTGFHVYRIDLAEIPMAFIDRIELRQYPTESRDPEIEVIMPHSIVRPHQSNTPVTS